ncbi:MAG TPA: DUF1127 domain-containing protein [Deferrisomatales bacterium]|nr:DUF1127 domain-containing protein [Deferrisomatales bacterium]
MLHIAKLLRVANLVQWAAQPLATAVCAFEWMGRVAAQRSALRQLDERQLKDIGLSRVDALREASRPFWDVPPRALVEGGGQRVSRPVRPCTSNRAGVQMPREALPSG